VRSSESYNENKGSGCTTWEACDEADHQKNDHNYELRRRFVRQRERNDR
jgi:hypothetical protein